MVLLRLSRDDGSDNANSGGNDVFEYTSDVEDRFTAVDYDYDGDGNGLTAVATRQR
jgi:hypothetical protein